MNNRLAVFTTKKIVVGLEPITTIVRDDDGEWQFLGNSEVTMEDMLIVSLEQILEVDPSLKKVLNMAEGFEANLLPNGEWQTSRIQ